MKETDQCFRFRRHAQIGESLATSNASDGFVSCERTHLGLGIVTHFRTALQGLSDDLCTMRGARRRVHLHRAKYIRRALSTVPDRDLAFVTSPWISLARRYSFERRKST